MSKKRFTAVNTLLVSTSRTKKGGFAKVKFQLTAKVTAALEWPEMPEGTAEWCPDVDEVLSDLIEFTPNNSELARFAVSIDASSIGDFIVVRKRKKAGKNSVRADKLITEVIAIIKFTDPTGCAKLEQYMQSAARSEMLVVYTPQPSQDELPGTRVDMSPSDSQASLPMATEEQRERVQEMEPGEGERPTHAQKVAERRQETEKKKALRKQTSLEAVN